MRSRLLLSPARWSAVAAAALALGFGVPSGARAQDTSVTGTLRGNPDVSADRLALLRQEFKERQREIREVKEHVSHGRRSHGRKAEPATGAEDYANRLARSRVGLDGIARIDAAPTNTRTNNPAGDAANAGQAEQQAVFLGDNGLCAWNDGQGFNLTPQDVQGYGYSTNGGATWTDGGIPPKSGTIVTWSSDPSVSLNEKTGEFYYIGLTTNTGTMNGVAVARAHFAGGTLVWDGESVVASGLNSAMAFDKEWVAADSSTGDVYATWTLFTVGGDNIYFARSTDGGVTWGAPLLISSPWENNRVSGSRPAVGPSGEVYVTYSAIGPVDVDSIKIAKSTDAGLTFTPSVVSMTEYDNYYTGAPGFNRARAVTFPSIAVDRTCGSNRGRVYESIQDCVDFYADNFGGGTVQNEVENNGNFANATPFTIGQTLRGAQSTTADQDWWKFNAVQGTTYGFYVDSLRTSSFKYSLRLYCPNDTTVLSRLAFSGDASVNDPANAHALIVWTAPTTNTYYLRTVPVASTGGYRIQTWTHVANANDVARDTRDVMVSSSADGQTSWSPRLRVNDDAPLYDNWLPEVAVGSDGNPYTMWFDWRDAAASCFGGSNIYVSRSTNGGVAWAANQVATTVPTPNWTQVLSNIAPNQGDYNGMTGGDFVTLAFADGRDGDANVYEGRLNTLFTLSGCPGDQVVAANSSYNSSTTVNNLNVMFGNNYHYTVSVSANWPGYPASGSTSAPAGGSGAVPISIAVPDTAADGEVVQACVTVSYPGLACSVPCCFNITVLNPATAVEASLIEAHALNGAVHISWQVLVPGGAQIQRSDDGHTWNTLGLLVPDGNGRVSYVDNTVLGGHRYGYRLAFASGSTAGETWLDVPVTARFALDGARPNPSVKGVAISFSLANDGPASIEMLDLNGRRVAVREVGSLGPGYHVVQLDRETAGLPAGIYAVRLLQGGRTLTSKVTLVR